MFFHLPIADRVATIYNAVDPSQYFAFSIRIPSNPFGAFTLTCGTDCDNWMLVDDGDPFLTYVEVTGSVVPTPEPSSLALLGTGTLVFWGFFATSGIVQTTPKTSARRGEVTDCT